MILRRLTLRHDTRMLYTGIKTPRIPIPTPTSPKVPISDLQITFRPTRRANPRRGQSRQIDRQRHLGAIRLAHTVHGADATEQRAIADDPPPIPNRKRRTRYDDRETELDDGRQIDSSLPPCPVATLRPNKVDAIHQPQHTHHDAHTPRQKDSAVPHLLLPIHMQPEYDRDRNRQRHKIRSQIAGADDEPRYDHALARLFLEIHVPSLGEAVVQVGEVGYRAGGYDGPVADAEEDEGRPGGVADPGDGAEYADVHGEDAGFGEEHGGPVEHAGGDHAAEVGGLEVDLDERI